MRARAVWEGSPTGQVPEGPRQKPPLLRRPSGGAGDLDAPLPALPSATGGPGGVTQGPAGKAEWLHEGGHIWGQAWGASVRTPSLSPLLWLKDHPQPLCPVLETLRGTALNARCRVKELTLALGTEARGNLAQATWGGQKSLFAQTRSPKRSLHWTSAPAIDRSRVGQGGPSGPVPLRSY